MHYDLVSDQYIEMIYSQVIDKYMEGALVCVPEKIKRIPPRLVVSYSELSVLSFFKSTYTPTSIIIIRSHLLLYFISSTTYGQAL